MVEYICITVTEPILMGNPAGGYVEMLDVKNSAREHLIAWHDKQAMHEYLMELKIGSNLKRKEYGTVMSTGANKDGLELLVKFFLEDGPLEVFRRDDAHTFVSNDGVYS